MIDSSLFSHVTCFLFVEMHNAPRETPPALQLLQRWDSVMQLSLALLLGYFSSHYLLDYGFYGLPAPLLCYHLFYLVPCCKFSTFLTKLLPFTSSTLTVKHCVQCQYPLPYSICSMLSLPSSFRTGNS